MVLSAIASGTTNTLVEISDYLYKKNVDGAKEIVNSLENKYRSVINELYDKEESREAAFKRNQSHIQLHKVTLKDMFTLFEEREILAQGELINTTLMNIYFHMSREWIRCCCLHLISCALTKIPNPTPHTSAHVLPHCWKTFRCCRLPHIQGYICRNAYGEVDNLQRGGKRLHRIADRLCGHWRGRNRDMDRH